MKRLGYFTGKIYTEEDFNSHRIHECCLLLSDDDSKNEKYLNDMREKFSHECENCHGCPESNRNHTISDDILKDDIIKEHMSNINKPPVVTIELNYAEVVAILHACRRSIENDKLSLERNGLSPESRDMFNTGIKCCKSIINKVSSGYLNFITKEK